MAFSFAVWNIERFNYLPQRVRAVGKLVHSHDPDVFGILEFLAKDAARQLVRSKEFRPYDFAFTDSAQGIEILVGWKRDRFRQVLFTQRRELQVGSARLRPGGLLSVLEKNTDVFVNLLFLHTDSGTDATAFSNRQKMFEKVWSMKRALEKLPEQKGRSRFIVLGDLNTMGRKYGPSGAEEIAALRAQATNHGMRMLTKTHEVTWSGGRMMSNLDHVLATNDLQFQQQSSATPSVEVLVDGWVNRTGEARTNFIKNISDHCLLFAALR